MALQNSLTLTSRARPPLIGPTLRSVLPLALVLLAACSGPQTTSSSAPQKRTGVVDRLSAVLDEEFGLRGVTPRGLNLLSVGHMVAVRGRGQLRSQASVAEFCAEPAARNDEFIRRGPMATFSFDEEESFTFDARLGLQASQASDWLPDLKMYLTDGDTVKMTLNLQNAELLVLNEARFARYLAEASETCHALAAKAPFKYVRELILAEVEFTFRRRGQTGAGIALGWTGPSRDATSPVSGFESDALSQEESETDGEVPDGEASDGEQVDGEAPAVAQSGGPRPSLLGVSADGKWRVERGGRIVSNQKLVVGVALAEYAGR